MDLYVNEIWHDSKLAFGHLSPCKVADIHDSPSRNIYLTLFSNGTVWVNYRVRVKGPCSMDLSNFPMDTQTCLLIYESWIAFSLGPSPKAVQARTMLGVNALLAIIMQFGSTLRKLPRVSYVKAIGKLSQSPQESMKSISVIISIFHMDVYDNVLFVLFVALNIVFDGRRLVVFKGIDSLTEFQFHCSFEKLAIKD
uniref:Neurotransmitter-gated ion-channel ligand-binding domain-containing protein n=1 Tax=Parascaris equorum TaxID=6256 RepID=A0A914S4D4_PAREQ